MKYVVNEDLVDIRLISNLWNNSFTNIEGLISQDIDLIISIHDLY